METLYGIFGLVALVVIAILWDKAKEALSKAVNKNVLSRSEYKEGVELVSTPITLDTSAAATTVLQYLEGYITVEKTTDVRWLVPILYQTHGDENAVIYAFGNKIEPKVFTAGISLTRTDGRTKCTFHVIHWTEQDGVVIRQAEIRKLRKQVTDAFVAIESGIAPDVRVERLFCSECGAENRAFANFCKECGCKLCGDGQQ